jgi:hypothetical protein
LAYILVTIFRENKEVDLHTKVCMYVCLDLAVGVSGSGPGARFYAMGMDHVINKNRSKKRGKARCSSIATRLEVEAMAISDNFSNFPDDVKRLSIDGS